MANRTDQRINIIEMKKLRNLDIIDLKKSFLLDVLKDLYAFTLTCSILRVISRNIRNFISTTKNSNQDSINT